VVYVGPLASSDGVGDWFEHTLDELRIRHHSSKYVAGGSIFSAFWRTLLADCICQHNKSLEEYQMFEGSKDTCRPLVRRTKATDLMAFLLWWLRPASYRSPYLGEVRQGIIER
jgi:bacillopeptidase F (M6 metalloprotease family)